jgi:LmbE family N-acetylglucosaminyl deacetylase
MTYQFYVPESALAIAAHPDDLEFGFSGTAARWAQYGTNICYVICTSGDVGIAEPGMTRERAAEIREVEARAAASVVGVKEVVFLREPDGLLEATIQLRKKLVREIRRFKPEVVVCGDPTVYWMENYINHPDHRAAALAALDAVFPAAGQPHLFQDLENEGLKAHKPRKVFISGRHQDGMFVDITSTMDLKVKALSSHTSQMNNWDFENYLRTSASKIASGKEMEFAEAFRVITLGDDENWEKKKS